LGVLRRRQRRELRRPRGGLLARVVLVALFLGHAAPHAVGLMYSQRVLPARFAYRAVQTHLLRGLLPGGPRLAPFAFRMEEQVAVGTAARAAQLPVPEVRIGPREAGHVGHGKPFLPPTVATGEPAGQSSCCRTTDGESLDGVVFGCIV